MLKKTFNVKELGQMLGFSKHTIYDWVKRDKIPYLRVGRGHIRFDPAEVGRALRGSRRVGPAAPGAVPDPVGAAADPRPDALTTADPAGTEAVAAAPGLS